MKFNEDSRVKIPTLVHLTRLGYEYLSLKDHSWDPETNIFKSIFFNSLIKLNPGLTIENAERLYDDLSLLLDNEDLGKAFYDRLIEQSGIRIIDFENFERNTFHVVTELPCVNDDEEFRPDITLLINGLPLVFIEVKKPNNMQGVQDERERMTKRLMNKKFRKFVNITQFMIFSNNMEYDDGAIVPLQGAFYATPAYNSPVFNYFREELETELDDLLAPENEAIETFILRDTNLVAIKSSPEYATNKNPERPTNRISTSMLSKARLGFLLQYGLAYVKTESGFEKHIMRYPQLFATKAIERELDAGTNSGIIWHTQGSGKTALTYFNVKYLTIYFRKKGIVPKFFFIVDRLDLLDQAKREFNSRGLVVNVVNDREEFATMIKSRKAVENDSGKAEITVVNIHKFKDDPNVVTNRDYNLQLQRVYFLDEVHRSYNPEGSFLANLKESDPDAIRIGLTGTPLLGDEYDSKSLFGKYIHKYYYNASIKDGYTLRLLREEIETSYKLSLQKALEEIEILKGGGDRRLVYAHPKYVEPMLDYIVEDFQKKRLLENDAGIGAMVVCDSSDQAKMLYEIFQSKYEGKIVTMPVGPVLKAAEPEEGYNKERIDSFKVRSAALILHDVGTKADRKEQVELFKEGKIDLLIVYNMLLTGFDASRLKKLYLGRVIRAHNLLQTLTRVNRPYKKYKFG